MVVMGDTVKLISAEGTDIHVYRMVPFDSLCDATHSFVSRKDNAKQ